MGLLPASGDRPFCGQRPVPKIDDCLNPLYHFLDERKYTKAPLLKRDAG